MNLANQLTLARVLMVPVLVIMFALPLQHQSFYCATLFILAAITDALDGWFARKLNQQTRMGAVFDPVADKLMVSVSLVLLVGKLKAFDLAFPSAIVVGRELLVSGLREWMAEIGERQTVRVATLGKWKTFIQIVAIASLMFGMGEGAFALFARSVGRFGLYCAAILTLMSMVQYLRSAWPVILNRSQ